MGCIHCWKDLQKPQQPLASSPKAAQIETALDKLDIPHSISLPANAKALLSLPLAEFKKIHTHSCTLWYCGELCYIAAVVSAAFLLYYLVSQLLHEPSLSSIPLLTYVLLLFVVFSLASIASAGYLLRHIRTRAAQRIILGISIAILLISSPLIGNPFTIILASPFTVGAILALVASRDKYLFSDNPLSHAQIHYYWQHLKEQRPTEENEIPPERTPGRHDKLHTILSAYCIALPFILAALLLIPALSAAREASRSIACQSNLKTLGQNLQRYQNEHSAYPQSIDEIQTNPPLTCPCAKKRIPYMFAPGFPPEDSSLELAKVPVIVCSLHKRTLLTLFGDGHVFGESKPQN